MGHGITIRCTLSWGWIIKFSACAFIRILTMTKKKLSLQKLIDVIEKLRDPVDGCQWDVQQTSKSLSPYIIEEAYELIEALESSDVDQICDELGDVLLQVVFQVQIAKEKNHFDMEQVINKAIDKMIRRHPHIFSSNGKQKTIEEQRLSWEKIKAKERLKKGESTSPFLKINSLLPAVNQAVKLQSTAGALGLDFKDLESIMAKIEEEIGETKEVLKGESEEKINNEVGDLFFSVINLARRLNIDPELCIRGANKKFANRCAEYYKIREKFERKTGSIENFSPKQAWKAIKEKEAG